MNTFASLCLLFVLISICGADKCKKICVFNNQTCITPRGYQVFKIVVSGANGLTAPLDPLYIEEIYGSMNSVQYKLTKITLIGLKKCEVPNIKLNAYESTYKQFLFCPKLIFNFHFEVKERTESPGLYGSGVASVNTYEYGILNEGKYGVFVNSSDHRPHFFIEPPATRTHLNGKLIFKIQASVVDNCRANETERYLNTNWRKTEEFLLTPIIKKCMKILLANTDIHCRTVNLENLIPETESNWA